MDKNTARFAREWHQDVLNAVAADWDSYAAQARELAENGPRACVGCGSAPRHYIAGRPYCDHCAPLPPPPATLTAQMLADIWRDEDGPARVAALLARMPERERNRLAVDYWNSLRPSHPGLLLLEVGIQFELAMLRAA